IRVIGDTLQAAPKAHYLVENLEERINIISHKLKFITDENKPRVLFLSDVSPVQLASNTYLETVARIAGGTPISAPLDAVIADVIVVVSEKPIPQLLTVFPALLAKP